MAAVRERRETVWSSLCTVDCHGLEENKLRRAGPVPSTNQTNRRSTRSAISPSRHLDEYEDQAQHIDMDLVLPRDWEKASRAKRLQKSRDFHDFEFDMFTIAPDLLEPAEVASADELFFKGQLLPLQHDPRLQLVQTLSNLQRDHSPSFCPLKDVANFDLCRSLEGFSTDVVGFTDSRSSSFRSRRSSFWESGEKDSRDSISSRCSNGSSQDSSFPAIKRPVLYVQPDQRSYSHPQIKRWSWRALFNNLKKVSKIWVDDQRVRDREHGNVSSNRRPSDESLRSISIGRGSSQEKSALVSDAGWQQVSCHCSHHQIKHKATGQASERWKMYMNKLKLHSWKISHQKPQEKSLISSSMQLRSTAASTCRSSSSTPLTKSPMRSLAASDIHTNSSKRSSAAALSCPPSMRSSPHHSGVLATVNKSSNHNSSMHDLHNAVQAAIDHCKQSQISSQASCRTSNPNAVYAECHVNS